MIGGIIGAPLMSAPLIDLDHLLKLRLVVARFGEMDLAKWWNTKGQLGRLGTAALRRGFPRTHRFAQARSVFAVAAHRVVPKCAKDRSLAIAHGLEDVFWVEGNDGKWTARKTPTHSIDELVRERTSPAVKSALKSLLEAPSAVGAAKKTKKGKANA
jgi:hypothetical protein